MLTPDDYDKAEKFQEVLNKRFPRLKWAVACYGPATSNYLPDENCWLIRATIDLADDGLVGLMPIQIKVATSDEGPDAVAQAMVGHMVGKILYDPLDVHKMELICT